MDDPTGNPTEVVKAPEGDTIESPSALLRVVAGPDTGKALTVDWNPSTVGSHPSCSLRLMDRAVSRFHLEVGFAREGLLLKDLGSTNGTFVGSTRVREAFVTPGDSIRVGASTIEVTLPDRGAELPIAGANRLGGLVGSSIEMRRLFALVLRIAQHDVPVLLQGETGTGKEVVAREVHAQSGRRDGPFVVVDCGAIPSDLIESELFGHVRGAFSGATNDRQGAFEEAEGGTLFLDEVGELDVELQPRLLRAVENRQVKRVGANAYKSVDARVVAATHRDLRVAVNAGTFREDLYFRLAVATLQIPPLRKRVEDIPLLVAHFFGEAIRAFDLPPSTPRISPDMMRRLASMEWNGNCRELRSFVERTLILSGEDDAAPGLAGGDASMEAARPCEDSRANAFADARTAGGENVAPPATATVRFDLKYKDARAIWLDFFERVYVAARLAATGGNISRAAREMEIDRAYLLRLARKQRDRAT